MYDVTMGAAHLALRGLGMRADIRANNIANVHTPGFRGQRVEFESALADALRRDLRGPAPTPVVRPDMALPNPNGSTVDLETEMVGMMKDNLLRDAMVNAFNNKTSLYRAAIGGR